MINRVVLAGRLTKDPVLRKTANGASVVSFTVACTRRFKQEGQPDADFINTVAWNKTADIVHQYTHKGSLVGVEGRIQTRSYDAQSGKSAFETEVAADSVQFLGSKSAAASNANSNAYVPDYDQGSNHGYQSDNSQSYSNDFTSSTLDIASDDLPF
ncbi:single-stranded DNA-binding protein [[Clostridium] innocuum]|uniref:single-stranded DNA-binding protein n=1 Tax=Clostridium innocuum TaxID=1522 RepID=UPI0022E64C2A|nr:single-stranded DNA-binding protein [[Clostridium] innocuum]